MKRIWFVQQKPFEYMPLQAGLGYISTSTLQEYDYEVHQKHPPYFVQRLCPKIYTTRTRRMKGEYYVVKGSRFKAEPVEPRIEFKVEQSWRLKLRDGTVLTKTNIGQDWYVVDDVLRKGKHCFAELDLGYKSATFKNLRDELLKLNPMMTIDTPFYINKLEPIR